MGQLHEHAAGAAAGLVPRHRHPLPVPAAAGHRAGRLPQGQATAHSGVVGLDAGHKDHCSCTVQVKMPFGIFKKKWCFIFYVTNGPYQYSLTQICESIEDLFWGFHYWFLVEA